MCVFVYIIERGISLYIARTWIDIDTYRGSLRGGGLGKSEKEKQKARQERKARRRGAIGLAQLLISRLFYRGRRTWRLKRWCIWKITRQKALRL